MSELAPLTVHLPEVHDTQRVGAALGRLLRAGDLVILTGDLGAGKTTLTQGIAEGLHVRGPITSPLVHVDAYRLAGALELDDLDLDTDVDRAVTIVEWGEGVAEALGEDRLEITLREPMCTMSVRARGDRWAADGDVLRRALQIA